MRSFITSTVLVMFAAFASSAANANLADRISDGTEQMTEFMVVGPETGKSMIIRRHIMANAELEDARKDATAHQGEAQEVIICEVVGPTASTMPNKTDFRPNPQEPAFGGFAGP